MRSVTAQVIPFWLLYFAVLLYLLMCRKFSLTIKVNGGRKRRDETALSRKIICGICGNTYRRKQFYNRDRTKRSIEWKCGTRALSKEKCNCSPLIKEGYLLDIVLKAINKQTYLDISYNYQIADIKNERVASVINQYIEKVVVFEDEIKVFLKPLIKYK